LSRIKNSSKPFKIGALLISAVISIGYLYQVIQDGDQDLTKSLIQSVVLLGLFYGMSLVLLRLVLLPFKGVFRTVRFGYRTAVVASRTSAAGDAAKMTLAGLDTWPEGRRPPGGVMGELDWEGEAQKWRANMAYASILPTMAVGASWVLARLFSGSWYAFACVLTVVVFKLFVRKVQKDDQLSQGMAAYLLPRLKATCSAASEPLLVHRGDRCRSTGFGPMRIDWAGRQFTLKVAVPVLNAAVAPLTRETYEDEAQDLDFGDPVFDASTIVTAYEHEYLARLQLTPTVRSLVMALITHGALCSQHEVSLTVDLNAGSPVSGEIDAFLRLAGALVTHLADYNARDQAARLHFALDDASSAQEEERLLTALYEIRQRGWVQNGLGRWIAGTHGQKWLQALRMVRGADRGPLAERIISDDELPIEDRARALGAWLEEDAEAAAERVLELLGTAGYPVVGFLLTDAHWREGERWRDRGLGLGDVLSRVEVGDLEATQKVLAAALILGSAVDHAPSGDLFLSLIEAVPKYMTELHVEALEVVRDFAQPLDALADEADRVFEAAVVRLKEEARSRAGQLSLAVQGAEGGLAISPPDAASTDDA